MWTLRCFNTCVHRCSLSWVELSWPLQWSMLVYWLFVCCLTSHFSTNTAISETILVYVERVCVWTVFFEVNDLWPISLARWFLLNLSCLKVNFVGHSPRSRIKMLLFLPIDAVRWLKSGSKVGKTSCTALQYRKCSECCCSGRLLVESFVLKWSMPVSLLVLAVLLQFLLYPCKCSVFYKQLNDWLIDCLIDWRNLGWGHCGTNVVCSCALYNFVTSLPGGAW